MRSEIVAAQSRRLCPVGVYLLENNSHGLQIREIGLIINLQDRTLFLYLNR